MKSNKLTGITILTSVALALVASGCDKENDTTSACVTPAKAEAKAPEAKAVASEAKAVVSAPVKVDATAPAPAQPAPAKEELPKIVVTVNGKELSRTKLDEEMKMITSSPQFSSMPKEQASMIIKQYETRFIDRFINQTILLAEADKQAIKVTDEEMGDAIKEIKNRIPPNVTLENALKERGMDMDEFKKNIESDLRIRNMLDKKVAGITNITDEAVAKFYEENKQRFTQPETAHARHILVKVDKDADEATKKAKKEEIEGYRKQIIDGTAKFEDIAKEHSDCPSGKRAGGDLGSFGHGQMVPEFDKAAFEQEVDKVGPVIETSFGYHIVQVLERTPAGERKLDEVKDQIKEQLLNQEKQKVVEAYLKELRDSAKITYGDKK